MIQKIILAGFGGQGIIASGKLLACAAMKEGLHVTHFPSYGAEMRGGTCNCSVILSDREISSPVISTPDVALVLNGPSLSKYKDKVAPGGKMIINSSLASGDAGRLDVDSKPVCANEIAEKLGNPRGANMVMLGAYAKLSGLVSVESLASSISEVFPNFKPAVVEANVAAIKAGYEAVQAV